MSDELRRQMERASAAAKCDAGRAGERLREDSRRRLAKIAATKVRTAFVGALSSFEKHFGAFWGHGLPPDPALRELADAWERCRQEILTNGNNQLRALESELALYDVMWTRYRLDLPARPEPKEE